MINSGIRHFGVETGGLDSNLIQDNSLADKEAWKTTPHTQFVALFALLVCFIDFCLAVFRFVCLCVLLLVYVFDSWFAFFCFCFFVCRLCVAFVLSSFCCNGCPIHSTI